MKDTPLVWADVLARGLVRISRGKDPFDRQALVAAANWRRCAVGEVRCQVPKFSLGWLASGNDEDMDEILYNAGTRFDEAVTNQDLSAAVAEYVIIRNRTRELKGATK